MVPNGCSAVSKRKVKRDAMKVLMFARTSKPIGEPDHTNS